MIRINPGFRKRVKQTTNFPTFALLFLLVITSCNPSLRFATVRYNAADINYLLDSTGMTYLTIQNSSTDAGNYKKPFTLVSYARTKDGGFVDTARYNLQPVEGNKPKTFKGKTVLGNFILSRDSIVAILTDPKTKQRNKEFAYLIFTPVRDNNYGYLYFNVRADNNLGAMGNKVLAVALRPCPPATWCIPTAIKTVEITNQ